jgi:hypothetical protein
MNTMKTKRSFTILCSLCCLLCNSAVVAQTNAAAGAEKAGNAMADIAQKLNNPVADLISVSLQNNFEFGGSI